MHGGQGKDGGSFAAWVDVLNIAQTAYVNAVAGGGGTTNREEGIKSHVLVRIPGYSHGPVLQPEFGSWHAAARAPVVNSLAILLLARSAERHDHYRDALSELAFCREIVIRTKTSILGMVRQHPQLRTSCAALSPRMGTFRLQPLETSRGTSSTLSQRRVCCSLMRRPEVPSRSTRVQSAARYRTLSSRSLPVGAKCGKRRRVRIREQSVVQLREMGLLHSDRVSVHYFPRSREAANALLGLSEYSLD